MHIKDVTAELKLNCDKYKKLIEKKESCKKISIEEKMLKDLKEKYLLQKQTRIEELRAEIKKLEIDIQSLLWGS